jgi:hypothetical protein
VFRGGDPAARWRRAWLPGTVAKAETAKVTAANADKVSELSRGDANWCPGDRFRNATMLQLTHLAGGFLRTSSEALDRR